MASIPLRHPVIHNGTDCRVKPGNDDEPVDTRV